MDISLNKFTSKTKFKILFLLFMSVLSLILSVIILLTYHFNWIKHENSEIQNKIRHLQTQPPEHIESFIKEEPDIYREKNQTIEKKGIFLDIEKNTFSHTPFIYKKDEEHYLVSSFTDHNETVAYAEKVDNYVDAENILIDILIITLVITLIALSLLMNIFAYIVEKPLKNIIDKTQNIDFKNMSFDVELEGNKKDIIVQLANTFNNLIERLKKSSEKMKQFNHDVSHELKTPLAIIISDLELAIKTKNIDMLQKTKSEAITLSKIIDQMLFLAHEEVIVEYSEISREECVDMFEKIQKKYSNFYSYKNIHWKLDTHKEFSGIKTHYYLFENLLNNAIENAYKHANENSIIHTQIEKQRISIKNKSQSLSQKEIDNLLTPFYKASKSKHAEGYGIGLSVMKKITDLLQYKLSIQYQKGYFVCTITWK